MTSLNRIWRKMGIAYEINTTLSITLHHFTTTTPFIIATFPSSSLLFHHHHCFSIIIRISSYLLFLLYVLVNFQPFDFTPFSLASSADTHTHSSHHLALHLCQSLQLFYSHPFGFEAGLVYNTSGAFLSVGVHGVDYLSYIVPSTRVGRFSSSTA